MNVLICIDDTDAIGTKGTGYLADVFRDKIRGMGGSASYISRHQLYVHEDVPYTSHNSAMCFEADIAENILQDTISMAQQCLKEMSAPGSDPGLCVAVKKAIPDPAALIGFGKAAKSTLLTKQQAWDMACAQGIHLSEHGGTGQGIVGALAGTALRLYGHDGRIKGKIKAGESGQVLSAGEIKNLTGFEAVVCIDGTAVGDDEPVTLTEGILKAVLLGWKSTLVVAGDAEGGYRTLTKDQVKCY
jgi:hypothetical protein